MRHLPLVVVFVILVFHFHAIAAQNDSAPASIRGQVVEADSGTAVVNARVILERRTAGSAREVVTDAQGLFVIEAVEPGSYLIHAERAGYITTNLPSGYARPVPLSMNLESG